MQNNPNPQKKIQPAIAYNVILPKTEFYFGTKPKNGIRRTDERTEIMCTRRSACMPLAALKALILVWLRPFSASNVKELRRRTAATRDKYLTKKNTAKVEATKNDQKTLKPPYPPGADEAKAVIQLQKGTTAKREKMYNMFYNYWTIKSHTKLLHKDGGLKPPARQKTQKW